MKPVNSVNLEQRLVLQLVTNRTGDHDIFFPYHRSVYVHLLQISGEISGHINS